MSWSPIAPGPAARFIRWDYTTLFAVSECQHLVRWATHDCAGACPAKGEEPVEAEMPADDEIPEGQPVLDGEPADGEVAQGQMPEGSGPPEEGQVTGGEIEGEQEAEEPVGCACFSCADDEKGLRDHLGDLLLLGLGRIVLLASARSAARQT